MRTFESGATRNPEGDKLNYIKALDPKVIRRYVEYLGKHRRQEDGNLRDWDNWKKGIPREAYLESLGRHFMELWEGAADEEETLCALLFNVQGLLHEKLKGKPKEAWHYSVPVPSHLKKYVLAEQEDIAMRKREMGKI